LFNCKFKYLLHDVLRALGQNPTEAEIHKCCENWTNPGIFK